MQTAESSNAALTGRIIDFESPQVIPHEQTGLDSDANKKKSSNKPEETGVGQSRRNIQMSVVRKLKEDFDQCNDPDKRLKISLAIAKMMSVKIGNNAAKKPLFT